DARPTGSTSGDRVVRLNGQVGEREQLGQLPMNAPSVFNFFRPGFSPPNGPIAAAGKVAPEFQGIDEVSVAGYANFMRRAVSKGLPMRVGDGGGDFVSAYTAERKLADDP